MHFIYSSSIMTYFCHNVFQPQMHNTSYTLTLKSVVYLSRAPHNLDIVEKDYQ